MQEASAVIDESRREAAMPTCQPLLQPPEPTGRPVLCYLAEIENKAHLTRHEQGQQTQPEHGSRIQLYDIGTMFA
jgi:hypothetical protein